MLCDRRPHISSQQRYQPHEFSGWGQTLEQSPRRYSEALELVVKFLSDPDGAGDYQTSLFHGSGAVLWPKPVQRPIPFWGASVSEASFSRYGALGWPILTFPANQEPADFKRQVEIYRAQFRAAGHDPARMRIGMTMFTYLEPRSEQANRVFEAGMQHYFGFLHRITHGAEA